MKDADLDILDAMRDFGGSFVKALSEACRYADERNYLRLKTAFPEYWVQYGTIAKRRIK